MLRLDEEERGRGCGGVSVSEAVSQTPLGPSGLEEYQLQLALVAGLGATLRSTVIRKMMLKFTFDFVLLSSYSLMCRIDSQHGESRLNYREVNTTVHNDSLTQYVELTGTIILSE